MSWLAENLASKGYVVAAPYHDDPPITDLSKFVGPLLLRPLDDAFVAHALQAEAARGVSFPGRLIDPKRVALVGYSMGGYGALAVAGVGIDPAAARLVPGGYLAAYARGGAKAGDLRVSGLKAVVVLSPFGGRGPPPVFKPEGLADLQAPTLFIVGDKDDVVGFDPGVKTLFDGAVNADRYLLVFKAAGHSIGMDGAPPGQASSLWDQDWFEDPVWRKERTVGVSLHFITAFLDLHMKGQVDRAAYLDVVPDSDAGVWPFGASAPYAAYSAGTGGVTVWKGFQKTHAAGMRLMHRGPAAP
jgi:predicted dienelactone hydrolase